MSYTIVKHQKSVGIGIILALLLGPIGLFYSTITGGFILTFLPFIGLFYAYYINSGMLSTLFSGLLLIGWLFYWLVCPIWAIVGVTNYNRRINRLASSSAIENFFDLPHHEGTPFKYVTPVRKKSYKELIILFVICFIIWFVYINSKYLKADVKPQIQNSTWINQSAVSLFVSPTLKSRVIGHVSPGSSFTAIKQTKYFIKVEFNDAQGQIRKGYLQKSVLRQVVSSE